ncbi:MAG: cadherin-like beta sandwich domain-containing protein, partial [Firmicutes bacterium]|nr:cadherin-like beta sandwich domain-containing protein [Bacillota bacterium]
MKRKIIGLIMTMVLCFCMLPTTAFAHVYYGGTISSDVEERDDTILLNADTTIAEGVTFALTLSAYQHIELKNHTLTNYGTITTAYSSNEFDGGTFYNYGVCEITGFYKVTVYDLTLSSIALSSGTLSPSFAAGTREYAVTVDNSVTSIDITPTLNTGTGVKSMTVNGTTAASGAASTVSLSVGVNSIPIVITASDGSNTANTYTLTVTRASAADYTITNALFVSAGTLGISQDMLQWSNVDAPGGYKLEIYTESGTRVYSGTLTNNYTPASEVLTSSGTYYFTVYALDANGNELSSKTSSVFTYSHTHSYEAFVTAPTCTENGFTTYTCSVCGDSYVANETTATGHSYEAVVTAPTCTEGGYTTYTCSVCGDSYTSDETAATGHSYEAVVTDPTCTEGGYTAYTCSVCGDSYTSDETAAT